MINVSVIVPIYNAEHIALKKCIESLVHQTLKEIEIILVDDGSTQECRSICDEYALTDKRIRVIHKTNGGVSSARNCGVSVAHGEYIGFVDSDDYVEADFYMKLYMAAKKNNSDLVCSGYIKEKDGKKTIENVSEEERLSVDRAIEEFLLFRKIDFRVWNKIFKREIAKEIYFSEEYRIAEDELYIYNFIMLSNDILYIPYAGYIYNINSSSVMSSKFSEKNLDALRVTEKIACTINNQKIYNVNYFKLNLYLRLWIRMVSDLEDYSMYIDQKISIERKIRKISLLKLKFYSNKTLLLFFLPIKIMPEFVEFLLRKIRFLSKKISL